MSRILVVGPGLIGKRHLDLIRQNRRAEIAGIVAPDSAENRQAAEQFNCPFFTSMEMALDQKPDGVVISSPNEFHFEQARLCILKGYPVLIEKPITVEIHHAFELVRLSRLHKVPALVGHHRNYSSVLKRAKELIISGRLGEIVSVIGSAQFFKPAHYFQEGLWRTKIGGGPILINMIHEIGNFRFLCGEISKIHAFSSNKTRKYEVEDTASINLEFENGALGTFIVSDTVVSTMSWENTSGENKSYPKYPNNACYFLSGTKGSLQVPTLTHHFFENNIEPSWWNQISTEQFAFSEEDPLENQLNHFIDVIENISHPIVSVNDGLANLIVIKAIQTSISEARPIDVKSIF